MGSTGGGLPPAVASAADHVAADPGLSAARHRYAFLPVLGDGEGSLPTALDEAAAVPFADGTAIRSEHVTLEEARAAFATLLPDDVDVTLYPCDD